jgi:UDP-glucose 4-epimerase
MKEFEIQSQMKILVSGGAGFIGSHTTIELINAGYNPIIVDNFSNSEKWIIDQIKKITKQKPIIYEGNGTDKNFLTKIFKKEKTIAGAIHFAALKAVNESIKKPLVYYRNNLDSALTLLEIMTERKIGNLIFSSSATIYGQPKKNPIPETAPRQPATNPYGKHPTLSTTELEAQGNHMVGLSANGSLNLASNHGWIWNRILKYYYSGISIDKMY